MGDDEGGGPRRRTSFEKDFREFVLKVIVGLFVGWVFSVFVPWSGSIWVPLLLGVGGVFLLASMIRGSSRHAD